MEWNWNGFPTTKTDVVKRRGLSTRTSPCTCATTAPPSRDQLPSLAYICSLLTFFFGRKAEGHMLDKISLYKNVLMR